jgi:hypothetical protein
MTCTCFSSLFLLGVKQDSAHGDATLPFLFWRVSLRRRRSPRSGERQVSRGDPWVPRREALTRVSPTVRLHRCCLAPLFSAPCELLAVSQMCDKTIITLSANDLIRRL